MQKCHWIVKEKVLCSINDGFKAPLKLVEVLKDILAIKTGNFYIANDWYIFNKQPKNIVILEIKGQKLFM